jgi:UDP-2-acetamido-2-deoxy-ribo-hexuluronate aminotransferase
MSITFPIQMYDPKREYRAHKKEFDDSLQNVLNHGLFINGPEVKSLEPDLAKFSGAKHCVSVSNGTDALKIALLALGVGVGDEVLTVAHTWISTAEVISLINAVPVFVDIEDETFNMDPSKIEEKITSKTKAIMPVSLYGQMPDMDKINAIASKHNLPVIEDGAQSFGGMYNGKRSCNLTTIGTTSFFPSKPLGCYGDGGACFTNDQDLALKMKAIKSHGGVKRFHHKYIGLNGRLDTMQAAILNVKLPYFEDTLTRRNACASYYSDNLRALEEKGLLKLPKVKEGRYSAWAQYSLLLKTKEERDNMVKHLKENKVNAAIFYPAPLHTQECFEYLKCEKGSLPVTERVCDTIFNLPCYAEVTKDEQDYIIGVVKSFFEK